MNEIDCDCPYCVHPDDCPLCGADVREGLRGIHFTGVSLESALLLLYQCPTCGGQWPCWPEGSYYRALAEKYLPSKEAS